MRRFARFLGRLVGGVHHAGLAGAFVFLAMLATDPSAKLATSFLLGGVYGIGVLALIRLFRVSPCAYPVAGLIAGPVPAALFLARSLEGEEWGGIWLLLALLGALIGTLEWARMRLDRASGARER